uniref:Uncharacterized protein n=1 Tax=Rattus norvegicus TaxID=10116 RepID=A0ABK0LP08_RAT
MKFLILTVTTLNLVIFFPYNGSQELYSQTNQHFSANPPSCKQTASNPSYTPKTEEYSSTEDSNSYPSPFDGMEKMNGSPSEGNHLEMVQTDVYNFPPLDNDVLHSLFTDQSSIRFAYPKETIDNPKSNALPSAGIIHIIPAISSFAPNSQIRPRRIRRPLSSENGISSPMPVTYYQYEFDLSDTPHFDRDSEITQSLEHFSSTGRTKALFASDPAIDMQNSLEKLTALADESALVTLKEQFFPEAGTTTNEEAEQDVFFTDSTPPIEESILIPRKRFISLIGKEKPALYTEIESEAEDDADFQETDDIPSSHNLQYFELEYKNFEKDGFADTDTTKSLSQFTVVPSTKITINGRDLIIPGEEYVDGLYVTNPTNKKMYFKPMATRVKINSLDESTKHNVETEGSTEVPTSSNSIHQIERMGYSRPLNIYYDVISKPISDAKEDPYMAWNTIRNKQLPSTMYSRNIIDLGDGYQAHTDITAKKNDRLT